MDQSANDQKAVAAAGTGNRILRSFLRALLLVLNYTLAGTETHAVIRCSLRDGTGEDRLACSLEAACEQTSRAMYWHSSRMRCTCVFRMLLASQAGIATRSPP